MGRTAAHRERQGQLGRGKYFPFQPTKEIFAELCEASAGGTADYKGVTWERVEDEMGRFWPVPEVGHGHGAPPGHRPARPRPT